MITDADVKKLEKTFATKKYLDKKLNDREIRLNKRINETENRLNKRIDGVTKYIDFQLEPIREFRKEFSDFKDRVLKTLDWLVMAYKKFDEEHTVLSEQNKRVNIKLDNHDIRISVLEKSISTA